MTGIGTAPAGGTSGGGGGGGGGGTTGSRYIAAPPQRLVDTRQSLGIAAALTASAPATITLPTSVPTGATAVVMNVTATRTTGAGFVTLWPAGQPQPVASNLNIELPGQTIANLVTVPAGQGGGVSVVASSATDLVVDLAGWYVLTPAVAAGRLVPITPTSYSTRATAMDRPWGRPARSCSRSPAPTACRCTA